MSKMQHGNKEAKKPKKVQDKPAIPATTAAATPPRTPPDRAKGQR